MLEHGWHQTTFQAGAVWNSVFQKCPSGIPDWCVGHVYLVRYECSSLEPSGTLGRSSRFQPGVQWSTV